METAGLAGGEAAAVALRSGARRKEQVGVIGTPMKECENSWEAAAAAELEALNVHAKGRETYVAASAEMKNKEAEHGHVPAMPVTRGDGDSHRCKLDHHALYGFAMVSRPVGRAELAKSEKPQASMRKEWDGLILQGVWDTTAICEREDIAQEARKKGTHVQFGRLHGICIEKTMGGERKSREEVQGTSCVSRKSSAKPTLRINGLEIFRQRPGHNGGSPHG